MSRYWFARLVIGTWVLLLPLVALLEPAGLASKALARSGPMGHLCSAALLVLSIVALLDVVLNDTPWWPSQFPMWRNQRHVGYLCTSLVLVLMSGPIYMQVGASPALLFYWAPAVFCAAIVPLDLKARHRR